MSLDLKSKTGQTWECTSCQLAKWGIKVKQAMENRGGLGCVEHVDWMGVRLGMDRLRSACRGLSLLRFDIGDGEEGLSQ